MRILVADDDPTTRLHLRSALTKLGYQVEIASDGSQAWQALQQPDAPELAILDWMMPAMTGPELCRKLRARACGVYVYVILLTSLSNMDSFVAGMEAGADDFIAKPFRTAELYARLRAGQRIVEMQRDLLAKQAEIAGLANHDALTGLSNRRVVLERLAQELERARRGSQALGVIMIDLDHFKQINDNHGHGQGDTVLRETARRLCDGVRPYDSVGRYGGEEFIIVVPHCSLEESITVAERLRRSICAKPMKIASGLLPVSASLGVSVAEPGEAIALELLVETADRALYRAKELGRNRVEWDRGEPTHGLTGNFST